MEPASGVIVCYVAHPIGARERESNLARARRWLRWLLRVHPGIAFALPWLPYCDVLEESSENRDRGIRDDLAMLARCDALVLVGGAMSPGMRMELEVAKAHGLKVTSYLDLGPEPPAGP